MDMMRTYNAIETHLKNYTFQEKNCKFQILYLFLSNSGIRMTVTFLKKWAFEKEFHQILATTTKNTNRYLCFKMTILVMRRLALKVEPVQFCIIISCIANLDTTWSLINYILRFNSWKYT